MPRRACFAPHPLASPPFFYADIERKLRCIKHGSFLFDRPRVELSYHPCIYILYNTTPFSMFASNYDGIGGPKTSQIAATGRLVP